MVLDLRRREIDIRFPSIYSGKTREYKFVIPIDQVFGLSQYQAPSDTKTPFILPLRTPPHFYKKLSGGISSTHDDAAFTWREEDSWLRQTNILGHENEIAQLKSPITLKNHPEGIVNTGRWTTYRITVDDRSIDKERYRVFRSALRDHNVPIAKIGNFQVSHEGDPAWDLLDASLLEYESISRSSAARYALEHSLQGLLDSKKNEIYLPFPVRYQLDVCISNGWINEHNLSREFLETLSKTDSDRAKHVLECVALKKLRIFNPMEIFELHVPRVRSMRSRIPANCVLIRSAVITPSTMTLNTPYVEMTNRVIRRYREHADRFLRVRFEDDEIRGFAKINATSQKTMDEVLSKIFRTLTYGIVIGDRHYDFLAFGNSQLREHGAYFFAGLPSGPKASHIRAWMGRFDHERIVAKHAARIGQCFSTTRAIRNAGFPPVRRSDLIDDVERNGFNFTDGVGKISRFYAETIAKELGIRGPPPSVYQFRMAGCKGVLAIAPELGATNLKIRKSQFKFETTYSGMEIIRWSEYWVATLNRQLILVLSALGVPDETFLLIQEKEIQLMERAMIHDDAALEALTGHVDPNGMTLTIANLVQAGFRRTNEPFVTSLLRLWRAWSIKYLKEKAKLPVREGAFILGCTDETGTLRGHFDTDQVNKTTLAKLPEVFVQITCPDSGHRKIIEDLCVIARNPSLHAGDMRVVRAIDVPALHHLVDVLVLPQTGDRDISSMCSGGDLDGDDYVVIWDQRLLPKIWNAKPMDYNPPPPPPLDRDVDQADITRFFVKYMKNDFLPKIAHAHLAWADYLDEGIRHEKCLDLAQLHSKAVDYPKTGQPAQMPKALHAKNWPHFMEKKGLKSYQSRKILGQLYDAVDRVAFVPNFDAPFDERILNACEPSEDLMQDARELKHEYDTSLQRIMAQHDIKTEFEVWSTFVLDHSKASKDYKFHEEIGQLSRSLKEQYYTAVLDKAGGKNRDDLVPWAVAMYRVTNDELGSVKLEGRGASMPFISFPWLLSSTLTEIVKGADKLTNIEHNRGREGLLESIHEPAFNAETQMYDDPYQPGTTDSGEGVLSDPPKVEPLLPADRGSPREAATREMNSNVDSVSNAHIDAHHLSNKGFPPGSYAPDLRIPPQPTAVQCDLIRKVIDDPKALDTSPNTNSDAFSIPRIPSSKGSAIEDPVDDFACNSRVNLLWPAIQPISSMPVSGGVSQQNSSRNSEGFVGDTPVVREPSEMFPKNRLGVSCQQSSGALTADQQINGQEHSSRAGNSLSEELAGLQLDPVPLLAPGFDDDMEHCVSMNRHGISPSVALEQNGNKTASYFGDPMVHSDRTFGGRKVAAQSTSSPLKDDGLRTMNNIKQVGCRDTRLSNPSLIDDEPDDAPRIEQDPGGAVMPDPLADGGGESDADRLLRLGGW